MKSFFTVNRLFPFAVVLLVCVLLLPCTLPYTGRLILIGIGGGLGLELDVEEMGGNIFNHLTVSGIKGTRTDKLQPVAEFAASDIRLDYSLASILGGMDAFLARLRISAGGVHFVLDQAENPDAQPAAGSGGRIFPPAVLPTVSVRDVDLTIRASGYDVTIADSSLQVDQAGSQSGQAVRLLLPEMRLNIDGRQKTAVSCAADLFYTAGSIRIEKMTISDGLAVLQGSLDWNKANQPPRLALQADLGGGHLQGFGTFTPDRISLGMELADIDISGLAGLVRYEDATFLAGKISGAVSTEFDPAADGLPTADIKLQLQQGNLFGVSTDARLRATLQDGALRVSELTAEHGENQVEIADGVVPLSLFTDWDTAGLTGVEAGAIRLHSANIPALLTAFGVETSLAAVPAHVLDVRGSMAGQALHVDRADFKTGTNTASLDKGSLRIMSGEGISFLDSAIGGTLLLHISDLREFSSLLALPPMAGRIRGSADFSGTLRRPVGRISLDGEKLLYQDCGPGDIRIEARADSKELHISTLQMHNGADRLEAAGRYFFETARSENITGRIFIEDISRYTDSCSAAGKKIAGRLEAVVATMAAGETQLDFTMSNAAWAGFHSSLLRGHVTTDRRLYRITDAELVTGQGALRFSADVSPQPAEKRVVCNLGKLSITAGGVDFGLESPAALVFAYGEKGTRLDVGAVALTGPVGSIRVLGDVAWREQSLLQVRAENLVGKGWIEPLLGREYRLGGANVLFSLYGPLAAPSASLTAGITGFACPRLTQPLSGDIAVDYNEGSGLAFHKFHLATPNGQQISLTGLLPFDPLADDPFLPAAFDLQGKVMLPNLRGIATGTTLNTMREGELHGEFRLAGSWEQPSGNLDFKGSNFYLGRFVRNAPEEPLNVDGHIDFQPGIILLKNLTLQGASFSCGMTGKWFDIPSLARFIRHPPEGLPGTVAFDGRLDLQDAGWLTAYAKGLRRLSGKLDATVSVHGPAANPKFSGAAAFSGGSVRLENATLPAIEKFEIQADLVDNVVNLRQCRGVFGGAPFQANGSVTIGGEDASVINCRLQGENLLFYRDETLKIRADTDLTAKGPWRGLELNGTVVIVDGRYAKNVDFLTMFRGSSRPKNDLGMQLFSLAEAPWRDMLFDVQITSDQPFPVANNMAKGAVRPNLRLTGTGEVPVLTGRIFVDPTRITVPAGKIMIESGVVTFPENDPDRPTFNLNGRSTLAGYDITLVVQGTIEEPVVTLSSDPALAEDELLLLVLTGTAPQSSQDKTKRAAAGMNMAVYLGKGLLSRWFGGEPGESEESILDRFELDFGRQLSKSGEETIEAQFRVIEGLFLPGDRLYLTSEKDIYDNFNVGAKVVFRFK